MNRNRITKTVKIGGFPPVNAVFIGGRYPLVIQTMWKDPLSFRDLEGDSGAALVSRIQNLQKMGCGLLRFAVPGCEAAEALGNLASMVSMPLCADIHFDYKIALRCLDFPVAKLRINPGNIGGREKVKAVLEKAGHKGVPIRIGVNAGSLPSDLRVKIAEGMEITQALVQAALRELAIFGEFGFQDILVSMKASGIADTIIANRLLSNETDVPLHIGLTEAGPLVGGTVRNAAALFALLRDGIGDTIRVSLSDTVENEVIAGREILAAASECIAAESGGALPGQADAAGAARGCDPVKRLRRPGVRIVSCPRCGRCG
ncbi:MAG: flavodoxin-dependent (E)-4-hydroxy-3-methylbut-2-enyl-diphosphate synthase, partial [Treponema sp.]|nr:flavodoxin-dependent (E)-4-hydroxy-3-methylbut-2-enyl-diphosphate synthase [Treponema sp.]